MKSLFRIVVLVSLISTGSAFAGDDCRRAMADWHSREAVSNYVTRLGLESERLRIDDGCYEVRFQPGTETSRYLPGSGGRKGQIIGPSEGQLSSLPAKTSPDVAR